MRLAIALVRYMACWLWTLFCGVSASIVMLISPIWGWMIFAKLWGCGAVWLIGAKFDIVGEENLRGPAVFICNHQSQIDVAMFPALLPRTLRIVAKHSLKKIPLWGWALAAGGAILVDRTDPRGAMAAIRDAVTALPEGWSVAVFPEGTRSRDGSLGRFKKGAFHIAMQTGLPLVPFGLEGGRDIIPADAWVARSGKVFVTVGAPIPTDDWKIADINDHIADVRAVVEECMSASCRRKAATLDSHPLSASTEVGG